MIELYDASGAQLDSVDASFGEETLEFTVPADGNYTIRVIGFAGDSGAYTISLEGAGTGTNGNNGNTSGTVLLTEPGTVAANEAQALRLPNSVPIIRIWMSKRNAAVPIAVIRTVSSSPGA